MSKSNLPIVQIVNVETGEVIERQMTQEEFDLIQSEAASDEVDTAGA